MLAIPPFVRTIPTSNESSCNHPLQVAPVLASTAETGAEGGKASFARSLTFEPQAEAGEPARQRGRCSPRAA